MHKVDDKDMAPARLYSRSMLDLARSEGRADELLEELQDLVGYLEKDPALANFFSSPLVDLGERAEAIERWFRGRSSDLLVNSLQVLNRKGRLVLLPTIAEVYRLEYQQLQRQVEVHVHTAVPLSDSSRERLQQTVSRLTARQARLIEHVDASMLGGLVLQIGDQKIDGSVRRELEEMREALELRSAHELHRLRQQSAA